MDRRCANRKRTQTKVFLHHPELPQTPCFTRDMSANGVFVEIEGAMKLERGTRLEMTFAVDLGNLTKLYQLSVVVAQIAEDGLGLSIERSEPARTTSIPLRAVKHGDCKVVPLKGQRSSQHTPFPFV